MVEKLCPSVRVGRDTADKGTTIKIFADFNRYGYITKAI